jgi:Uncharacterized protein conserved in bacteria (DUF2272)
MLSQRANGPPPMKVRPRHAIFPALLALLLAGCAAKPPAAVKRRTGPFPPAQTEVDPHVPFFAVMPYEPFSREDAIAIALREWRLFGDRIDDDPPGTRPEPLPDDKPEREPGLWERVGEYWWIGMEPDSRSAYWTGKQDEYGNVFPASQDYDYAWSAAFISYVMRIDGAGARFPYSRNHSTYINAARTGGYALTAERPTTYAPQPGDLICLGRGKSAPLTFDDLPTDRDFPAHCAIVVAAVPRQITIIGGNVDDAVTMIHVPTTLQGMLADPDGQILDTRYPWFVVLKVLYDR